MSIRILCLVPLLVSVLAACDKPKEAAPADRRQASTPTPAPPTEAASADTAPAPQEQSTRSPSRLLARPAQFLRFEMPTEALAIWGQFASLEPTLLLLSNDPFLVPVPEPLRPEVAALTSTGTAAEIARRSGLHHPDPLLLSQMSVDAALRQGWFGRLAWVIPLRDPEQALSREVLQQQFTEAGLADSGELETLSVEGDHRITGTLRDVPVVAATLPHLPPIEGPAIVHLDLSYFQPLYKNGVSTPLLGIIQSTLTALRDRQIEVLAVTFSYGNRDGRIALDVRFLGELLKEIFEKPSRLEEPLPDYWRQQADTLYLANFFQKEEIRKLHLAQEQALPKAGWVKFNLYRSAAQNKEGTLALDYLAKAVALDPVFALEYLELAQMAYEKKRPDEAMRMLGFYDAVFSGDPQAVIQMAQIANELGKTQEALARVRTLQKQAWSPVYYPEMPEYLRGFREFLEKGGKAEGTK